MAKADRSTRKESLLLDRLPDVYDNTTNTNSGAVFEPTFEKHNIIVYHKYILIACYYYCPDLCGPSYNKSDTGQPDAFNRRQTKKNAAT
ncbi:MAG: hypothetical protein ABI144_08235 [Gallionella sp.]